MTRRRIVGLLIAIVAMLSLPNLVAAAALGQVEIPIFGDNLTLASAAVGFVMPLVIAAINRVSWPAEARGMTAFVCCLLAAALLVYVMGYVDSADWLRSALIVFTMAIAQWNLFWKPSGIGPVIEEATG